MYISNIPQSAQPEEIQQFIGGYGKIVQFELPLVDSLQYSRINEALAKTEAATKDTTASFEDTLQLSKTRRQIKNLKETIFEELRKSRKGTTKALHKAVAKLITILNTADFTMIKSRKEAEAAVDVLSGLEKIISPTGNGLDQEFVARIENNITNYLQLKDSEIAKCIKNIPSWNQLIGKQRLHMKDDIDIGEAPAKKPSSAKPSDDVLRHLDISITVPDYLKDKKHALAELYEIMSEKEVETLLDAGVKNSPIAISVDEVASTIIQNLRTWKKRNVAPSNEEAFRKEKALVEMLVQTKKKYQAFSENYKNHYQALYEEVAAADPGALVPGGELKAFNKLKEEVRNGTTIEKLPEDPKLFKVSPNATATTTARPIITVEEIDKAEREYRRSKLQHKGYCMVTFSTTVLLLFLTFLKFVYKNCTSNNRTRQSDL